MEKKEITLSLDSEKMEALAFYLKKENTDVQHRMEEALRQIYESTVPEPVREFVDRKAPPPPRPKRPAAKPAAPKQQSADPKPNEEAQK